MSNTALFLLTVIEVQKVDIVLAAQSIMEDVDCYASNIITTY